MKKISILLIGLLLALSVYSETPHTCSLGEDVRNSIVLPLPKDIENIRSDRATVMFVLTAIAVLALSVVVIKSGLYSNGLRHESGGEGVIPLIRVDTQMPDYYSSDFLVDDEVEPVVYQGSRIWCIRESMYWFLLEQDMNFYAFDIREIATQSGIHIDAKTLDFIVTGMYKSKIGWVVAFLERLEARNCRIDIGKSIAMIGK
ncbi:hypothetical protein [Bacteroides sp. 51]|uniref:hypothetical protein n=1 Tax=Bacteroides sp. 51 TaxID=2302938 RepID=UPI0013D4B890|nr:hypothetical protein [Bacteroides sp. 51]NDV83416.1 hypothetical protein [Bacteroides sp. 51]